MSEQVKSELADPTTGFVDPRLTDAAADKAKELLDREDRDDLMLRFSVSPGGCAGLRQALSFSPLVMDGDHFFEQDNGLTFVVDRMSYPYMSGAVIDFVDTIDKMGFQATLPSAQNSCGCGESFS